MNRYRLFSQFLAINIAGLGFLVLAVLNGWCARVIEADSSYVSFVIVGLFALALVSAAYRIIVISNELDRLQSGRSERLERYRQVLKRGGNVSRAIEMRLFSHITHIRTIGNGLVVLGLIGTVIGFIIVANSVDTDSAADVGQVGSLVGSLLHGMGVAFYTTLVGAVFSLWLSINYQMLHTATATLIATLLAVADDLEPSVLN